MHLDGGVTVLKIEKVSRPGFSGLFHCVTFELQADGLTPSWCQVWVHSAYADTDLERVAHSLLSRKLLDLAKAASARSCSTVLLDAPRIRCWQRSRSVTRKPAKPVSSLSQRQKQIRK